MSPISPSDPAAALVVYLRTQVDLDDDLVSRPELPSEDDSTMPKACIVVRRAGGYQLFGNTNPPIGDPRLDIFCYGETWLESENLAAAVVPALRFMRSGVYSWTDEDDTPRAARLRWARVSAGPLPFDDPDTNWPCTVVSAQVAHLELAVA